MKTDNARFEDLRKRLNLAHLDHESGFFAVERVSAIQVEASDGHSAASNAIYYALSPDQPQNHLHHLSSDDYHILIEGGPADYFIFHPDARVEKYTLGRNIEHGQRLMIPTPGACAKAIRLHKDANYLLVGSVVTPAYTPNRVTIGAGQSFIETYEGAADWATPGFLKSLIGPNWID
mgnify:CR=1 FL=1